MTTYRATDRRKLLAIAQQYGVAKDFGLELDAVSRVFPLRANRYVLEHLIDWDNIPDDPMFRLVFPQPEMLPKAHLDRLCDAIRRESTEDEISNLVREIRLALNPHPADQTTLNIPRVGQQSLAGIQHKYHETVLFFPSQGQTCHAYCTYCFRWAQFVDLPEFKIASTEVSRLVDYLEQHPEVSDVLLTGGDPLIMRTKLLRRYLEPLLEVDTVSTIRIGTKALSWWPGRFVTDADADDLLDLFDDVIARGKHLALMAHLTHPRELSTVRARQAVARVRGTGAVIRAQAPLVRHINDHANVWAEMWREQVKLGIVPYYMFIPRDTGARRYFEVPLVLAHQIYKEAISQVSGLARTARGPSMSTSPGKVVIDGPAKVAGEDVLAMRFLQARNPQHVHRPFFAKYDEAATWLDDLRPAFGAQRFFFEE